MLGKILFFIIVGLGLLALLLPLLPLKADIRYKREGSDDRLDLIFMAGASWLSYRLSASTLELQEKFSGRIKVKAKAKAKAPLFPWGWRDWVQASLLDLWIKTKPYLGVSRYLLKKTKIQKFQARTEIGYEDPAVTGILAGLAWGMEGTMLALMQEVVGRLETVPQIEVVPNFQENRFRIDFHGIFGLRLGHIIIAGGLILRQFLTLRRG